LVLSCSSHTAKADGLCLNSLCAFLIALFANLFWLVGMSFEIEIGNG